MSQRRSSGGRISNGTNTGTPSDKALERFTVAQVEEMVNKCVHAMIVLNQKCMPIKRSDITKSVCQGNSRLTKSIVRKAEVKLRKVFGYSLNHSADQTRYYISNAKLLLPENSKCIPDDVHNESFVLFVVLAAIEMSINSETREQDLITLLENIGLDAEDPRRFLDKFHKQELVETSKKKVNDNDVKFYKWGERAQLQIDKRKLYDLFKKYYGLEVKKLAEDDIENSG